MLASAVPPPDVPYSLKGRTFEVTFFIAATGDLDLARTRVGIELPSGFRKRFLETLTMWRFAPAVQDGCAVPGTTTARFTF